MVVVSYCENVRVVAGKYGSKLVIFFFWLCRINCKKQCMACLLRALLPNNARQEDDMDYSEGGGGWSKS